MGVHVLHGVMAGTKGWPHLGPQEMRTGKIRRAIPKGHGEPVMELGLYSKSTHWGVKDRLFGQRSVGVFHALTVWGRGSQVGETRRREWENMGAWTTAEAQRRAHHGGREEVHQGEWIRPGGREDEGSQLREHRPVSRDGAWRCKVGQGRAGRGPGAGWAGHAREGQGAVGPVGEA